jgi:hypothetical protein
MREADSNRPAFTLRFRNEATHRSLRLTARALGVSMNELAETAIEHELALLGADLEQKLARTVALLRSYRQADSEDDIAAFARAEVEADDPLRSRQVTIEDACEIGGLFARSLERG